MRSVYQHLLSTSCLLLLLCASCKKADNNNNDQPTCDFNHSRPISMHVTSPGRDYIQYLSYDSRNRLVQYTKYNSQDTIFFSYPSADTVRLEYHELGGTLVKGLRVLNSHGDNTFSDYRSYDANASCVLGRRYYYYYDSSRQLTKYVANMDVYSQGVFDYTSNVDSTVYTWVDGNIVHDNSPANGASNYLYQQGTYGSFIVNPPQNIQSAFFISSTLNQVFSRNLVSQITYNTGQSTFVYSLDTVGRVTKLTATSTGITPQLSSPETLEFKYECFN